MVDRGLGGGGQLFDDAWIGGDRPGAEAGRQLDSGQGVAEPVVEPGGEDRAEDGDPEGGTDGAEEGGAGGGDAEVLVADGVLHDQHQHLHHQAEAEAEDQEVAANLEGAAVLVEQREQQQADGRDRGAGDREDPVVAGPGHDLAGADRGDQHADHHRQHVDAGHRRRDLHDHLEEGRQIGERAEHREADHEGDDGHQAEGPGAEQP